MTLKRQGAIQTYQFPVSKRLKTVEKKVRKLTRFVNSKPDFFYNSQASTVATGAIATLEVTGANSLSRNKILGFDCVVYGTGILDVYLLQCDLGAPPVYADFPSSTIGSSIYQGAQHPWHVWKHMLVPSDGTKTARFRMRFPMGFSRDVDGSGNNKGKALYMVIKNETGGSLTYTINITGYSVDE